VRGHDVEMYAPENPLINRAIASLSVPQTQNGDVIEVQAQPLLESVSETSVPPGIAAVLSALGKVGFAATAERGEWVTTTASPTAATVAPGGAAAAGATAEKNSHLLGKDPETHSTLEQLLAAVAATNNSQ
jgi:hypothetical protein